jgi:hypothetical protein
LTLAAERSVVPPKAPDPDTMLSGKVLSDSESLDGNFLGGNFYRTAAVAKLGLADPAIPDFS